MVDMNQGVAKLLCSAGRVELEFPDTSADFPVITISEVTSLSDYEVENVERISDVTYQVDVWDNGRNRKRCEEISVEVSRLMTAEGFTRVAGRGFRDPSGLHRKMMQFRGKFINL